jgi:hypothetical protein
VPAALRSAVAAAVLKMAEVPADRDLLSAIRLSDPLPADYERDYRVFEQIR